MCECVLFVAIRDVDRKMRETYGRVYVRDLLRTIGLYHLEWLRLWQSFHTNWKYFLSEVIVKPFENHTVIAPFEKWNSKPFALLTSSPIEMLCF